MCMYRTSFDAMSYNNLLIWTSKDERLHILGQIRMSRNLVDALDTVSRVDEGNRPELRMHEMPCLRHVNFWRQRDFRRLPKTQVAILQRSHRHWHGVMLAMAFLREYG